MRSVSQGPGANGAPTCGMLNGGSTFSLCATLTASRACAAHDALLPRGMRPSSPWSPGTGCRAERPEPPGVSAAAIPRPSAMPPAATTGASPARSTIVGTSTIVEIQPALPPDSLPWATRTSAPASSAISAASTSPTVWIHAMPWSCARAIEVGRHTHVEGDRGRLQVQSRVERLVVHGPSGVVDGVRAVRELGQAAPLHLELGGLAQRGAEATESAGVADRGRELDLFPRPERCQDDRHLYAKEIAELVHHDSFEMASSAAFLREGQERKMPNRPQTGSKPAPNAPRGTSCRGVAAQPFARQPDNAGEDWTGILWTPSGASRRLRFRAGSYRFTRCGE